MRVTCTAHFSLSLNHPNIWRRAQIIKLLHLLATFSEIRIFPSVSCSLASSNWWPLRTRYQVPDPYKATGNITVVNFNRTVLGLDTLWQNMRIIQGVKRIKSRMSCRNAGYLMSPWLNFSLRLQTVWLWYRLLHNLTYPHIALQY